MQKNISCEELKEEYLISQNIGPDSNISFLGVRGLKSSIEEVEIYAKIITGFKEN